MENDPSFNTCFYSEYFNKVACCEGEETEICLLALPKGTCPIEFFPCRAEEGGNCCKEGFRCVPNGCSKLEPKFTTTSTTQVPLSMMTLVPVVDDVSAEDFTREITYSYTQIPYSLNITKIGVNTTMTSSSNPLATSKTTKSIGGKVISGSSKSYYMVALTIALGLLIIFFWH